MIDFCSEDATKAPAPLLNTNSLDPDSEDIFKTPVPELGQRSIFVTKFPVCACVQEGGGVMLVTVQHEYLWGVSVALGLEKANELWII